MHHWIFISSTKRFRMNDWLSLNDFVEFEQKNKVEEGDIVYLYTTSPVQRIEYKMYVERINIPYELGIDDSAFSLRPQPNLEPHTLFVVRLRLLEKVDTPLLHLSELRKHGLESSMQGNFKVSGELQEYIESFFRK